MITGVVLGAGIGKRMHSKLPKVLHKICGREMIFYAIDSIKEIVDNGLIVVINEAIPKEIFEGFEVRIQKTPLGTGDAVKVAIDGFDTDLVLITTGDNPLFEKDDILGFYNFFKETNSDIAFISAEAEDPTNLGRVIRKGDEFIKIVEESDASSDEKTIKEINTGVYIFKFSYLKSLLKKLSNANAQGEYYLTDTLSLAKSEGLKVSVYKLPRKFPIYGVNNRFELTIAEKIIQEKILKKHMLNGVTIHNPETQKIDYFVEIGNDTEILPGCILEGKTKIESDCVIGPFTQIVDSHISRGSSVKQSVVLNSYVGENCTIGPFAYVRPENMLVKNVKIGTFVEVKKSKFDEGAKVPHLSYIGDATVGKNVNIGAGTITCNFSGLEGNKKNPTYIEDDVFVGSHSTLVAPLVIRKGAYTAAGSVITQEVPEDSLAIARAQQVNKIGWVKRRKGQNG
ncbi:bifunctional UDP-N-acetylglucosamine diphosphorylase/glucosamine-1-phosphate N-acetyltransferase GlmU [Caldisericum exile]|uniref:Bifunctional protein GlmU n=1 Tax=Caldisericum exile (strain DSM 21853 / NBRC 104410 / AZM16c01) TaxID=511051 RepID=A0A7U6GE22_CALEA|nr:bifunctional UDP-N-acetylglucosamine diphosphorylase/glucosamine-1-phosphate N-acetyltransferase GlmU [Caldisericum exile]BAL80607.1 UDP-N-acetylglucosamine pyrophosphorylase/glucosamine-1-phosphate N-acetyltransferase [Caldisericum exile AZM16c01]